MAAGAALAGAQAAHTSALSPAQTAPPAGTLSFDGAALGMTIGAWKSLSPPPGVGPSAAADCEPGIVAALRESRIVAATPGPGHATCAYAARFGDDVLLHSARLDDRYRIDGLRYQFTRGRLSEVDFTASVDAYNDIVMKLTHDYGAPTATERSITRAAGRRLPQVRQTWRAQGGVVTLTDPTDNPLRLSVRIAASGAP